MTMPPLTRRQFAIGAATAAISPIIGSHGTVDANARRISMSAAEGIRLVRAGQPVAAIVIDEHPTPAARLAAIEVQFAIEKLTGATLPIHHARQDNVETHIVIGDHSMTRELGLESQAFSHTEFLYSAAPGLIVLFGRDLPTSVGRHVNFNSLVGREGELTVHLPGMYEPQGSLRAAYHFLEICGARYYGPRWYHCIFPKHDSLYVRPATVRREPSIKYVNGLSSDDGGWVYWPIQRILYGQPTSEEVLLFARRMRTGGIAWGVNHSFPLLHYRARFGRNPNHLHEGFRPEFWPPEGSPSHQLCFTSQALAEQVARDAADYFDGTLAGKPYNGLTLGYDFFPVVPYDAGNYCTCEQCQAILQPHGNRITHGTFGNGRASDYVFQFVNRVARIVKKTHPDKRIATLAYEDYFWPPVNVVLESNVDVAPCIITCDHWKVAQSRNDWQAYNFWANRSKRIGSPMYMWNYYHHPEEMGVIHGFKVFPQFSPTLIHQLATRYHRDSVEGILLCGWGEGLDFYTVMKCCDDPQFDLNAMLREHFTLSYGPAAGRQMLAFYRLAESIAMRPDPNNTPLSRQFIWETQGTPANLRRLEGLLNAAEDHLPGDEGTAHRFHNWRLLMNYMKEGRAEWENR